MKIIWLRLLIKLNFTSIYNKDLKTVKDAINAIKVMEVRGDPLIGGTAAYGIALAVREDNDPEFIRKSAEELIQSRPTAINLKWCCRSYDEQIIRN